MAKHLVRFGVFEFELGSGDLWKEGRRIRLQNQPRQVLRLLVTRPGELVTREALRQQLWPDDTFVDFDNGLNVAVRKIRDALGDDAPSPRFVETERAQGYRFVAPVSEVVPGTRVAGAAVPQSDGADGPIRRPVGSEIVPGAPGDALEASTDRRVRIGARPAYRPHRAAVAVALLLVAAGAWVWRADVFRSAIGDDEDDAPPIDLAVLPFSGAPTGAESVLALGIPDGIVTRLSNVRLFRVRPTSAVARYHGQEVDARQVGEALRTQFVLVGALRTLSDRVRVSVQLVRTADGSLVWGRQYDRPRHDLAGIEDSVAEEVSKALQVRISDVERERLYRRYTRSGPAYERYLMGRARLRMLTEQDALRAIAEFEAACDLEPRFAPAFAGLAAASAQMRVRFSSRTGGEPWDDRAREHARRALELDPDLAEAHEALAAIHRFQEFDWDAVIRVSRRSLELSPSLDMPHLYQAAAFFHIGLLDEAEREVQAAREINPEHRAEASEILAAVNLWGGRTRQAAVHLTRVRGPGDSQIARYLLGLAHYYQGERQQAESLLESMAGEEGPLPGNARAALAAFRAARGASREARTLASRVAAEPDLNHHAAYGLGAAYAQLGEPATALRWLAQASATGFPCYPWYERDPLLDPVRTDPRFAHFMDELRRSWEAARAKYAVR